jgi:hypothetical protein
MAGDLSSPSQRQQSNFFQVLFKKDKTAEVVEKGMINKNH